MIDLFEKHIGQKTGLKQKIIEDFDNVDEINTNKNNSLYVSINNDTFQSPDSLIDKRIANEIGLLAKIRMEEIKSFIRPLDELKQIAKEFMVKQDENEKKHEQNKENELIIQDE